MLLTFVRHLSLLLQRRNAAVTSQASAETGKASVGTREATRQNCCTSGTSVSRWRRADSCFQFTEMPVQCSSISFYQHKFYYPHSRHYMPLRYCLYGLFLVEDKKGAQQVGSVRLLLNVLRWQLTYQGQAETNAEAWFSIALRPRKSEGSLGRTAQDGHLDSHTAPEL